MTDFNQKSPEFEPPQACISRIIKNVLPENVQVTKEARFAFTRAAGVFIFYLTHCANEFSKENKRNTIFTSDVLNAMKELDFGEYEPALLEFLEKYRAENESKKPSKNKKEDIEEEEIVKTSSPEEVVKQEEGDDDEVELEQEEKEDIET